MEKRNANKSSNIGMKKIILTGAESTGKTTLAKHLAKHYKTIWLPEYAREYVENLDRDYNYDDVLNIAKKQIELEREYSQKANKLFFVDTSLIITKVWFDVVYNNCPEWIDDEIKKENDELYLLCNNDIKWIADEVRENGGEKREELFKIYEQELIYYRKDYKIIKGGNFEKRFESAVNIIDEFLI